MAAQFLRKKILTVALQEANMGGVFGKLGGGIDPQSGQEVRKGYEKLLTYFRVSAPDPKNPGHSYFNEDNIKYLIKPGEVAPMAHWCGIFALYCLKMANMNVGTWVQGSGISSVKGIRAIRPKDLNPGDIGFVNNGLEHHFIIEDVVTEQGRLVAKTIEGNSAPNSNFHRGTRPISSITAAYTAFSS